MSVVLVSNFTPLRGAAYEPFTINPRMKEHIVLQKAWVNLTDHTSVLWHNWMNMLFRSQIGTITFYFVLHFYSPH